MGERGKEHGRSVRRGGSRASRMRDMLERQWHLVRALHETRAGRTAAQLIDAVATSRATLFRDIAFLREVGVPIADDLVNGERRYRLLGDKLPSAASPLRRAALQVAVHALGALRGTELHRELERLRDDISAAPTPKLVSVRPSSPPIAPELAARLERALRESRALTIHYRGARDGAAADRHVAPLELRLVKGQLYLAAHDLQRSEARTFKVARIASATLGERVERRGFTSPKSRGSVVVWSGELTPVTIRLAPDVARFASEYPLVETQAVETREDGSAIVRAEVAGEVEVLRWVLGWGRGAEVLRPASLRQRIREELVAALGAYGPEAKRGREGVSPIVDAGAGRR